jgi:hypothetical protein
LVRARVAGPVVSVAARQRAQRLIESFGSFSPGIKQTF